MSIPSSLNPSPPPQPIRHGWLLITLGAASILLTLGLLLILWLSTPVAAPNTLDGTTPPEPATPLSSTKPTVADVADTPAPAPSAISRKDDGFAITVELRKPQLVTVVIEDATGKRVRNLISETLLPAGKNVIAWDGYDDGTTDKAGALTRKRVTPGTYRARGLTHDGVKTNYEFTVYGGGGTPWPTDDLTGGWLADHCIAMGAAFIPSGSPYGGGKPQVLLTSRIAECGSPLVWVGTDGQTIQRRPLWGWDGGDCAAADTGQNHDPRFYAYILVADSGKKTPIRILGLATAANAPNPELLSFTPQNLTGEGMRDAGYGLSVRDGLVAFNIPTDNVVVLGDIRTGKVLGTITVPAPKGVLWLSHDSLLVSSAGTVQRCSLIWNEGKPTLGTSAPVITGLQDPRTIQIDPAGNRIYVADWGRSNQVRVYDATTFKQLLIIGQPGGAQLGTYNEQQMQFPYGLALDDAGQLWVAEADWMPKRVSVWDAKTGTLKRALYGPPHYGGGGTIDPTDKTRLFFGEYGCTIEFKLDWKTGTAKPVAIPVRFEQQTVNHIYGQAGYGPEVPWHVNGRTYLSLGYQSGLRMNDAIGLWLYDDKTRIAKPVSYVGNPRIWVRPNNKPDQAREDQWIKIKEGMGVNRFDPWFGPLTAWADADGDGQASLDETKFRNFPEMDGKVTFADGRNRRLAGFAFFSPLADLSLCGAWNVMIPPPTFRPDGVPVYDLSKAKFMIPPSNDQCWEEDGNTGILTEDGLWQQSFRACKDGQLVWSYPIEGTTWATPSHPGDVVEPTRLMGPYFKMKAGEAGILGVTNGERGNMYIMTSDGLFVQTIGGHRAIADLFRFPKAVRGMDVSGHSFDDEHFHPTVTHTVDDEVYMVAGKEHSSIFRLNGLESVRRRQFGEITLSEQDLAGIPATQAHPARTVGRREMAITELPKAPVVDGKLDDWTGVNWVDIGKAGTGALAIKEGKLYAAWRTGNPKVLANRASDPEFAFKRGGAVDLMIGPEHRWGPKGLVGIMNPKPGDLRLLACEVEGRKLAVLYRQVAVEPRLGKPQLYESPIGQVQFEDVAIISDQVELAQADGNVELSVPLKLLGISANLGDKMLGDMGILRGSGAQTTLRSYWNNLNTAMVSDIPTEATLVPGNWGLIKVWRWIDPVPRAAQQVDAASLKPGLQRRMWNSTAERVPQPPAGDPIANAVSEAVDLTGIPKRNDYTLQFDGFIKVPDTGTYGFTLTTKGGALLWIDDQLVVNHDGMQGGGPISERINLAQGQHVMRVGYLQRAGDAALELRWTPPGGVEQTIPASVLSHTGK